MFVKYYARNDEEKEFDSGIRKEVAEKGSSVDMALFIQNQMILSMLRHLDDEVMDIKNVIMTKKEREA